MTDLHLAPDYDAPPDDEPQAPTHDMEAERAVIGAILTSRAALDEASDILTPGDFYRPAHETIFSSALSLAANGEPVDVITVSDDLNKRNMLGKTGGSTHLHQLVAGVVTAANVAHHAHIVRESSTARRARGVLTNAVGQVDQGQDILDVLNSVRVYLDALATDESADVPNSRAVYEAIDALDEPPGDPTPWPSLTDVIAGWKPGVLYVCGARPGVGKSIIGVGVALDMARRGKTGALFSLEMSRTELYHRMLCSVGNVLMDHVQHRKVTVDDRLKLAQAAEHIAGLPLMVDDRSALTVAQIRARVKAAQRERPVGVVVVDYLQLVKPADGRADRRVQVDQISRDLKVMAKDLAVPVLALTQLNRGPEMRMDKTPHMSDLRESGGQEQDADVVLLLHRDWSTPETQADLKVIAGKNRHGPQSAFTLAFLGHFSRADEPKW